MDLALLVLRLALGSVFLYHGLMKRPMWKMEPSEKMPANMLSLMKFLSIVEPIGGLALILGFFTHFAALGIGFIMVGALDLKLTKWHTPFSAMNQTGWEFDLMNLAAAFTLFTFGGGAFSIDTIILQAI